MNDGWCLAVWRSRCTVANVWDWSRAKKPEECQPFTFELYPTNDAGVAKLQERVAGRIVKALAQRDKKAARVERERQKAESLLRKAMEVLA
jgi:hypothetical protein